MHWGEQGQEVSKSIHPVSTQELLGGILRVHLLLPTTQLCPSQPTVSAHLHYGGIPLILQIPVSSAGSEAFRLLGNTLPWASLHSWEFSNEWIAPDTAGIPSTMFALES